jgi:hypothetical protein
MERPPVHGIRRPCEATRSDSAAGAGTSQLPLLAARARLDLSLVLSHEIQSRQSWRSVVTGST